MPCHTRITVHRDRKKTANAVVVFHAGLVMPLSSARTNSGGMAKISREFLC
jgi:hypothetical protein